MHSTPKILHGVRNLHFFYLRRQENAQKCRFLPQKWKFLSDICNYHTINSKKNWKYSRENSRFLGKLRQNFDWKPHFRPQNLKFSKKRPKKTLRTYFLGHYGGKIHDFCVNFGQYSIEYLIFRPRNVKFSKIVQNDFTYLLSRVLWR